MIDSDEEIVSAFLDESRENLDQLDVGLIALEVDPSDPELLAQIFRTIHTIKGTCGFLGFHRLEALSHAGESLLGAIRSGELRLDANVTTSLLALVDAVRSILDLIETTGTEGQDDHAGVVAALQQHLAVPSAVPMPASGVAVPADRQDDVVAPSETTVRVDVAILDKLMDLVGELVLTRGQLGGSAATGDDGPLSLPYRQLCLVSRELQEGVMKARLQPVGIVTGRFRRVVRDLAAMMGKQIKIDIEGEEIGVDKAVNEALRDPLLHLVRNAVDHGIEAPEDRLRAGKPAHGTLTLRAFHAGGRVSIELADDGRGIDPGLLVERAIATGMLTEAQAAALNADQVMDLMFRPGLSTKTEITNISGRGVGLDVVRTALQQVGGSIEVTSEAGRGSSFRLNVPLTLAIMPVVTVSIGAQRFAIPQVDIREVVYIAAEDKAATLHEVNGTLVHRLRDRLLPLVDLAEVFLVDSAPKSDGLVVIVVGTTDRRFGIVVDAIDDTTEVVVKPLTQAIRAIRCFSGVTISTDGQPALIIDVAGLASRAGVIPTRDDAPDDALVAEEMSTSSLLLVSDRAGSNMAVELTAVRRLEQIAGASIERSGALEAVQYQDGMLPLIRLSDRLPDDTAPKGTDVLQVVVCESSIGLVGIVVDRIDDVVASLVDDEPNTVLLDVELLVAEAGVGSAV